MKKFLMALLLCLCLISLPVLGLAADGSPLDAFSFLQPMIAALLGKYGVVVQILVVIGTLRAINKPLFTFLHSVVLVVPGEKDDVILGKVETSTVYKWITYVLDFIGSVKLPTKLETK